MSKANPVYLSDKWKKAAIIGGLWASIEIVIGSFLHNLRIPFAGTILAAQGIIILLAFISIWNEKGIIIRAGIITALMKSISPSAIILGPMTGILTEALLLEVFLILFGKNFLGFILASAISISSAFLHKIITFLLIYGFDIINIYENLYQWFQKKIGFENLSPLEFILVVFMVYFSWGVFAGIIGYLIGKKAKKAQTEHYLTEGEHEQSEDFFPINKDQNFNSYLLIFNLLNIPLGLLILNLINTWFGLAYMIVYLAFALIYYKKNMRRLRKKSFWFQLLIIVILATLFGQEDMQHFGYLSMSGLIQGIELSLRVLFVVVGFTAISVELRNPGIQQFLSSKFLKSLYEALSISFAVLPKAIKALPKFKKFITQPISTFSNLVSLAVNDYNKNLKN